MKGLKCYDIVESIVLGSLSSRHFTIFSTLCSSKRKSVHSAIKRDLKMTKTTMFKSYFFKTNKDIASH